jgi:hypothetical protein
MAIMFPFLHKKKLSWENYQDDPFLQKQWIEHFFVIPLEKPEEVSHSEYIDTLETQNEKIVQQVAVKSIGITEIGKSVTVITYRAQHLPHEYNRVLQFLSPTENSYYTLIRFPNLRKNDSKKDACFRRVNTKEKRIYKSSPIQSAKIPEICRSIELMLHLFTQITPHQSMTLVTGVANDVIVYEFDGLQYLSYPLSMRAELYSKYLDLDDQIFGMNFIKFAQWIIDKKNDSDAMKINAVRVSKILEKIKQPQSWFS